MKATSYINDAVTGKKIFNQLNIMVPYVDMIGLCHNVAILLESMWCGVNVCDAAALPYQAHANYGICPIDFGYYILN